MSIPISERRSPIYEDPRTSIARRHSDPYWTWHHASTAKERFDFERALVEHEHPLAYAPGTSERRFLAFVAELAARGE